MLTLESTSAVAVSYAIGDFERAKHVVGHRSDDTNNLYSLELGNEWNVPDFRKALVELSTARDGFWFDQISITQTPTEIARMLPQISRIYSTLKVVILLPNAPCLCLGAAVSAYHAGKDFVATQEYGVAGDFDLFNVHERCVNACPVSSYHRRL